MSERHPRVQRLAVSISELSAMVGADAKTLRTWARSYGMPTYRVGGRVLVLVADFVEWLRAHRDRPEEDLDAAVNGIVARMRSGEDAE